MKQKYVLTEYRITTDLPQSISLGLVSDLHEHQSQEIIALLQKEKPDLIMVPGDIFERHGHSKDTYREIDEGRLERLVRYGLMKLDDLFGCLTGQEKGYPDLAYDFFYKVAKIAPVFYSLGNHEWFLTRKDRKIIKENSIKLLDNADCKIMIKGMKLRVGGLSSKPDLKWLDTFCKKDGYKILLCHHAEYYERYLKNRNLDLILSGHAHGGQIRWKGKGLYSPGQGFFPKYAKGVFHGRLVVTTGCSNTAGVPRWGNPCEVVSIHLKSRNE